MPGDKTGGYLGAHLDKRLNWKCNTEAVYNKEESRLTLETPYVLQCLHQDVLYPL